MTVASRWWQRIGVGGGLVLAALVCLAEAPPLLAARGLQSFVVTLADDSILDVRPVHNDVAVTDTRWVALDDACWIMVMRSYDVTLKNTTVDEVAGAKARADQLGIEFFNQDLQFDSDLALNSMDTHIASGIDGIIIVVPDTKIGPAVIAKAKEANVPLIAVDDNILDADGNAAPFVGFDAATIGTQVGEAIAKFYKDEGWDKLSGAVIKAVSVEDQDLEVCNIRTDNAAAAVLANIPGLTEQDIIHLPYDNTMVGGMDAMAPIVTANPDVTHWLLFSCNDDGVLGAWRALSNAGVDAKNVIGVGINGQLAGEEAEHRWLGQSSPRATKCGFSKPGLP